MKKETTTKQNLIVEMLASLFIMYFAYATIMSVMRIQSLQNLLTFYTYSYVAVAWTIVIVQAAILFLLFVRKTRKAGFAMSFLYMICFGLTLWLYPRHPHDFEGLLNYMSGKQHRIFAVVAPLLSLLGFLLGFKHTRKTVQPEPTPVVFT